MTVLKLTRIGASTGVVIPKDLLARLDVKKGDVPGASSNMAIIAT